MSTPVVAVLGTGTMGAAMARTAAGAGLGVRVWNRTHARARALADVATVAETVPEAVRGADVVVTVLHDADAVAEVAEEARGAFGEETVWVQQSTVGVAGQRRLADLAGALGVRYLDAPVLGTRGPAEDGALVVLASGPEELRPRVAPYLDAISVRTVWAGPEVGAGSRLKLAVNAWVLTVVEGVAESLALARELGLDPALFLEAVAGGATDAPYVQAKGRAMLAGDLAPSFALAGALKDAGLVLDAAAEVGLDLGLLPAVRDHLARAVAAGHGEEDMAATYLAH